ncbi:TetR-like C-terminal domain-containing protein [Phytohabitans flavus]
MFAELVSQEPPLPLADAMERALGFADSQTGPRGALRIAIQVWAESLRDPALAVFVADKYGHFRGLFAALARRAQETGELPADADPEAIGAALFGMIPGYALQRILAHGPDKKTYADALRVLIRA